MKSFIHQLSLYGFSKARQNVLISLCLNNLLTEEPPVCVLSKELQEAKQRSEDHVLRSEIRGGPGSARSQGIALGMKMSELSNPEEDLQDPGNPQGQVEAQLLGSEAGKAASPSASSPSVSSSTPVEVLPQEALKEMMANLVKFLFFKYCTKKLTFKTKVLNTILMGIMLVVKMSKLRSQASLSKTLRTQVDGASFGYISLNKSDMSLGVSVCKGGPLKSAQPVSQLNHLTYLPSGKLRMIMEDAAFTSVHWNKKGDTVVIEADLFQKEVLQHRGTNSIFETDSIKSFIRELNL
ncbi:hypothetical protein E5288_WYG017487 [Bos mutus]|uniref:HSF-type DNA-binding domain-containing protein n=1 Tax=Bos mutus TaxID=72004 RepID=A0A6B0S9E5_9CETA|nr:hypothetical protein [Bos mutus]